MVPQSRAQAASLGPNVKSTSPRKHWVARWALGILATIYLLALSASYYQRWQLQKSPTPIPDNLRTVLVPAIDGDSTVPGEARIAFRDIPAEDASDHIPVVLIHGSPGNSEVLEKLMQKLSGPRRLIAPDSRGLAARAATCRTIRSGRTQPTSGSCWTDWGCGACIWSASAWAAGSS